MKGRRRLFCPLLLGFLLPFISSGQDTTKVKLNGTEGEVFRDKQTDTVPKGKYAHWNEFDGPLTTLKFGGGFLYEYAAYSQDDVSKQQIDLEPDFKMRDFRVTMSGKFKFDRDVSWKIGIMYDGSTSSWFMRESGLMFGLPEISGKVFVGRTKEGYSLNKVMNGYSIWFMERDMAIDIIPILADGIKYLGYLPKQRLLWNVGYFGDWLSHNQSFSTYSSTIAARVAFLPVYSSAFKPVLHVGVSFRHGVVEDGALLVRSRPEANPAPYFIDTKKFSVKSSDHFGGELYYRNGPFIFGTEWNSHMMNSPENDNPVFTGGEVFIGYTFTGEVKPYFAELGIFSFIKVKRPVFKGGPGAWELVVRYSKLDLDDGKISGGTFWRITPNLNWYMSDNVHFFLTYGYGKLNRYGLEGATQFFQTRILFML